MQSESNKEIASLAVSWVVYGYSGHFEKPEGLVTKNYMKCEVGNIHIKSIVNPRTVVYLNNPHHAVQHLYGSYIINENYKEIKGPFSEQSIEKIRINHYWTKSYSEFTKKIERGIADCKFKGAVTPYDPNYLSEIEDRIMDKYIPDLEHLCE